MTNYQFKSKEIEQIMVLLNYLKSMDLDPEDIDSDIDLYVKHYTGIQLSGGPDQVTHIKSSLKGMRIILTRIIKQIDKSVDEQLGRIDKMNSELQNIKDFTKKYPFYVKIRHPKSAIKFFDSLDEDQETFNISKAAELLNLTRQTISNYMKSELYGFKNTGLKKVTKQEIYTCYLEKVLKKS